MQSSPSQGQNMGYSQSTADQAKTDSLTNQVNQNNSQFNGPVESTPYYKSLLQSGTTSTNQAYDNASRNMKQSMEGAGVSGASRVAAGNNGAIGASRAAALGTVGTSAVQGATQMQQQANAQSLQEAGMYSGAGLGYYSGANQAELAQLQQQGSMWNGLLQAGTGLGEAAILA
jgi:hypothetical protein